MKRPVAREGAAEKRPLPSGADSGGAEVEKRFLGGDAEGPAVDAEGCFLFHSACAAGRVNNPVGVEEEREEEGPFVNIPPKDEEDGAVPNIEYPGPGVTPLASNPSVVFSLASDNVPCC